MKLQYNPQEDYKELENLCRLFLDSQKGNVFSGLSARVKFHECCGIDIDHHIWANVLDNMQRIGLTDHYDHNHGDTQYIINIKPRLV